MVLAEKPFYSFQGEGSNQGKHSLFIRFSGCNLQCSECDSKFAWNTESGFEIEEDHLHNMIMEANHVVITGGEPLLPKNIETILEWVREYPCTFEIETNGVIDIDMETAQTLNNHRVQVNISPKENFKQDDNVDSFPYLLDLPFKERVVKFLVSSQEDIDYVKNTKELFNIFSREIYIQPKGTDASTILNIAAEYYDQIIENNWNFSLREHIILFGNIKGV